MSLSRKDNRAVPEGQQLSTARRSFTAMSEVAVFRRLYGPLAAKTMARDNGVSPSAVKKWFGTGRLPDSRAEAIIESARARLAQQLEELAKVETELEAIARYRRRRSDSR